MPITPLPLPVNIGGAAYEQFRDAMLRADPSGIYSLAPPGYGVPGGQIGPALPPGYSEDPGNNLPPSMGGNLTPPGTGSAPSAPTGGNSGTAAGGSNDYPPGTPGIPGMPGTFPPMPPGLTSGGGAGGGPGYGEPGGAIGPALPPGYTEGGGAPLPPSMGGSLTPPGGTGGGSGGAGGSGPGYGETGGQIGPALPPGYSENPGNNLPPSMGGDLPQPGGPQWGGGGTSSGGGGSGGTAQPGTPNPYRPTPNPNAGQLNVPPGGGWDSAQPTGLGPPIYPDMGIGGGGDVGGGGSPGAGAGGGSGASEIARGLFNDFQRAQDQAKAANEQRYQQILQGYGGLNSQQNATLQMGAGMNDNRLAQAINEFTGLQGGYGSERSAASQAYGNLVNAFGDRGDRAMARLEGLGQTETNAINDRATQQSATADQDLNSRGLANSTIRSSVQRGIDTDRSRALTNLQEDLAREKNSTDLQTSGDMLGAGERGIGAVSNLGLQGLQAGERFAGAKADIAGQGINYLERANDSQTNLGKGILDFMERRQDEYPSFETLANLAIALGQGGTQLPNLPTPAPTGNSQLPTPNVPFYPNGRPGGGQPAVQNGQIDPRILAVIQQAYARQGA